MIPFFYTYIDKTAKREIAKVLETTFLSDGEVVREFEESLAATLGIMNPVAVNSGTSALHLALDAAGIGKGDEVICPGQTFIATGMAIMYLGAKPVFADIDHETGNIDPRSIEKKINKKTRAILTVDWGGYPCDYREIKSIAEKYQLKLIEDAAHALGATYGGVPAGNIAPYTCFSFQAIKHLTTGDGGAVCCQERADADTVRAKRWFGIDRKNSRSSILGERIYEVAEIGYKYHMNNYAAALGLANLRTVKKRLARRRKIAGRYRKSLEKISGIHLFNYRDDRESAYWLFGFQVERREDFINAMRDRGIATSVVHQRIDRNPVFGGMTKDLVNQERFDRTQINIPLHDGLRDEDVEYIIESVRKGW